MPCRLAALCVLLYVFSPQLTAAVKTGAEDEQLKVVYIVNFLKFISFARKSEEGILVCYFADDYFSDYFKRITGVSVKGKALRIRKVNDINSLDGCEVLYVDVMHDENAQALLQVARNEGILDIGNGDDFVDNGGLISFSVQGNRLGFSINLQQAKVKGFQFSASLLDLAYKVVY